LSDAVPHRLPLPLRALGAALAFLALGALGLAVDPGWSGIEPEVNQALARVGLRKSLLYAAAHGMSVLALTILLLRGGGLCRVLVWAGVLFASTIELGMQEINGQGFELWEARLFIAEAGMGDEALRTYWPSFLRPALTLLGVIAVLELIARKLRQENPLGVFAALGLLALGFVGPSVVIAKTEGLSSAFPAVFKIPVVAVYANLPEGVARLRSDPLIPAPATRSGPRHLVLVVDESVRGDFLEVNGGTLVPTPFLAQRARPFVNFGVACAGTNSSAPSNILLQTGLGPDELMSNPAAAEEAPTIFQYARRSERRTAFLAAQKIKSWYYVSPFDLNAIDHYRGLRERHPEISDAAIDERLIDELEVVLAASPEGSFSYLLKMGAHFPYGEKHPEGAEGAPPEALAALPNAERRALVAAYAPAARWASDGFLQKLLNRLEGQDAVVVYTSDHGQSLLEGGIKGTHGIYRDPPASQANVPLMVFGTNEDQRRALAELSREVLPRHRDRMCHEEIFPTLLGFLGFEAGAIREHYGPGLFSPHDPRPRRFFSGDPFQSRMRALNDFD
jgi:glucan phosphoethanolaminetransferase (alkaline phosphatase superfamily)